MNHAIIALALTAISFSTAAAPNAEPKSYTLTNRAEACKKGYQRMEVEFVKVADNGSVSFKYKGDKVMGPLPKAYAASFLKMKVGDIDCIPMDSSPPRGADHLRSQQFLEDRAMPGAQGSPDKRLLGTVLTQP